MDWILSCLLWVTLTSAYRPQYYFDEPHHSYFDSYQSIPLRRDHENYESYVPERIENKSGERAGGRSTQRMLERSIDVDSGIQSVQEQERKRLQSSTLDDAVPRSENESYKIVNTPKVYPTIASRRGQDSSMKDSFVFPGPTSQSREHQYVPDIPEECLKAGICDNVPNYPTELANRLIAELGSKKDRLHIDEIFLPELAQRIGAPEDNIELCSFREKIVMPQAAPDKNGNWYFILNSKDNPIQGYRVEICKLDGSSCNNNIAIFPSEYTASCKQKYVQRQMTAIDKAGTVKFDMPFKVPSCCSCVARHKTVN